MKFCGRIRGLTQSMHGTLDIRPDQVMLLFLVMELSTHCDSLYSGIQTGSSNLSSLPRTRRNAGVICNGLAIHMKGGGGEVGDILHHLMLWRPSKAATCSELPALSADWILSF